MQTETKKKPDALAIIDDLGLADATAANIKAEFQKFIDAIDEKAEDAKAIVVTEASDIDGMSAAREARLELRTIRIKAENTRKVLKADSLQYGKAVQAIYNKIESLIKPIEEHLTNQEKFAEVQEAKEKAERLESRLNVIKVKGYQEFVMVGTDLENMEDEDWLKFQGNLDTLKKARRQSEQELIAKEKAEAAEKERLRLENVKLQKEKDEAEAKQKAAQEKAEKATRKAQRDKEKAQAEAQAKADAIKAEADDKARQVREANQAMLKAEKAKTDIAEAELKAKEEADAKAKQDAQDKADAEQAAKEEQARIQAAAPDKEKLLKFAEQLSDVEVPELSSESGKEVGLEAKNRLTELAQAIRSDVGIYLE